MTAGGADMSPDCEVGEDSPKKLEGNFGNWKETFDDCIMLSDAAESTSGLHTDPILLHR
jgi:hypothetical protein